MGVCDREMCVCVCVCGSICVFEDVHTQVESIHLLCSTLFISAQRCLTKTGDSFHDASVVEIHLKMKTTK